MSDTPTSTFADWAAKPAKNLLLKPKAPGIRIIDTDEPEKPWVMGADGKPIELPGPQS